MKVREFRITDQPFLEEIHAESGYAFKWPKDHVLTTQVIADVEDKPIAIVCARNVPEIILALRKKDHPLMKLQALAIIHEAMRRELNAMGYEEASCSLPPEIDGTYGRHLRRFGWLRAWTTYIFKSEIK
jgi:hypothetical protein